MNLLTKTSAVLAGLAATALIAGCGSSSDDSTDESVSTPTAAPTASASPTAEPTPAPTTPATTSTPKRDIGTFIDYETDDDSGVILSTAADAANLTGAPADFTAFAAAELSRSQASVDPGCPEPPQLYVTRLATGGWASGGYFVPQCGGYAALWAKADGTWKEVWSGQQLVECDLLNKYTFPAQVSGRSCSRDGATVDYAG